MPDVQKKFPLLKFLRWYLGTVDWHATLRNEGKRLSTGCLTLIAWGIGLTLVVIVVALAWTTLTEIGQWQEWGLMASAGSGDPFEMSRWPTRESCERTREATGSELLRRGMVVGLKCQGMKSWLELYRQWNRARVFHR